MLTAVAHVRFMYCFGCNPEGDFSDLLTDACVLLVSVFYSAYNIAGGLRVHVQVK